MFHCNTPGFQVIVANVTNDWRVMETPWDLVLELSREPFEIEQICEWLKYARDETDNLLIECFTVTRHYLKI